jgi:uncharacterized protein YndB with AHSA1/START domain
MDERTIEREIEIAASPATVFEVITHPEHLKEWWPDEAHLDPTPGAVGRLVFGDPSSPDAHIPEITVVDAVPSQLFSFRWVYPDGETATADNSLLVTFELTALGDRSTLLRMTETGWDAKAWTLAERDQERRDHVAGWDHFIPRLGTYAPTAAATA